MGICRTAQSQVTQLHYSNVCAMAACHSRSPNHRRGSSLLCSWTRNTIHQLTQFEHRGIEQNMIVSAYPQHLFALPPLLVTGMVNDSKVGIELVMVSGSYPCFTGDRVGHMFQRSHMSKERRCGLRCYGYALTICATALKPTCLTPLEPRQSTIRWTPERSTYGRAYIP